MKYLILVLFILLTGCSTLTDKLCKDALITDKTVHLDNKYYEECKPQNTLPDKATFDDVIVNTANNTAVFTACYDKQHNSIVIIKQLTNYKEPTK